MHIINECPNKFFTDLRNEYSKKVGEYLNIDKDKINLDEGIKEIYFQPKDNSITDGLKILKNYAAGRVLTSNLKISSLTLSQLS